MSTSVWIGQTTLKDYTDGKGRKKTIICQGIEGNDIDSNGKGGSVVMYQLASTAYLLDKPTVWIGVKQYKC